MISAIIPGAGTGQRMNSQTPKIFIELAGKPLFYHSIQSLVKSGEVDHILLAVPEGFKKRALEYNQEWKINNLEIVEGATTRQETVFHALQTLPKTTEMVLIHDGARPLASPELVRAVINGAREHGACIPSLPCEETVKRVRSGHVVETLSRDEIHIVQTPQAFYFDLIMEAHNHACERKWRVTDDATLVERAGRPVATIPGEQSNIKITHPLDLKIAEIIIVGSSI
ncbi:MAG: 2-C-methyl-D-erythritol 4-phosphate cytidylyltransferase [bacterium]